jgi:DNA-binding NtrC family response regulator
MANTVLIVDDSKFAQLVTKRMIAAIQPDWQCEPAYNSEEAMARVSAGGIDVMLIDFNIPGENGLALVEKIRALHPLMPIAIITPNVQYAIIDRARAMKAAFVAKAFNADDLRGFISGAALRLRGKVA